MTAAGVELSTNDQWRTIDVLIGEGVHTLTWRYQKYSNQFKTVFEEMAAEIEHITVHGISHTPRECRFCQKGVANKMKNTCVECPVNSYRFVTSEGLIHCRNCPEQ